MTNRPLGLHHPVVVSDGLDMLAERYRAMGFAPTHKTWHPWGTVAQSVLFPHGGIELMGIDDPRMIDERAEGEFGFGRFIADQLNRREGIAVVALHSADVEADATVLTARGLEPDGTVSYPTTDEAMASLAMLVDWDRPGMSHLLCQQHQSELVRLPALMQHPNGAFAIDTVVYAVPEPYALWQRFAAIWGEEALHDLDNSFSVATPGGELLVLDRPAAEARFAPIEMPEGWRDSLGAVAMTVRVADLNLAHVLMMQNRVPHVRMAATVRIPPSHAGNLILDFAA